MHTAVVKPQINARKGRGHSAARDHTGVWFMLMTYELCYTFMLLHVKKCVSFFTIKRYQNIEKLGQLAKVRYEKY